MLTRRQRMILDAIRAAHAAGFHPSPARLAERIELGGRQAMRADVGRLIVDGEIVGVESAPRIKLTGPDAVPPPRLQLPRLRAGLVDLAVDHDPPAPAP